MTYPWILSSIWQGNVAPQGKQTSPILSVRHQEWKISKTIFHQTNILLYFVSKFLHLPPHHRHVGHAIVRQWIAKAGGLPAAERISRTKVSIPPRQVESDEDNLEEVNFHQLKANLFLAPQLFLDHKTDLIPEANCIYNHFQREWSYLITEC